MRGIERLEERTLLASVLPLLDEGPNYWEDNDFESFVLDAGTPGVIDVGDRFVGVLQIQTVNGTNINDGEPTITAVFAIECINAWYNTGDRATATVGILFFGPLQDDGDPDGGGTGSDAVDEWADLNALPFLQNSITGLGALQIPTDNDTMVILYDHPDIAAAVPDAGVNIGDAIDTYDDSGGATKLTEFGFTGAAGEFWRTIGPMNYDDMLTGPVEDLDMDEPGDIPALVAAGRTPVNQIAINVTANSSWLIYGLTSQFFPTATNLQAVGLFTPGSAGNFAIRTDTDLVLDLQFPPPTVSGQKLDGEGNGLAGVTIYLDVNNNSALDADEPFDVTDADGYFSITHLPGVYAARELVPDYYVQTTPASGFYTVDLTTQPVVTGLDFVNQRVLPVILDDGDPGFTEEGPWIVSTCEIFYQSDARYLCSDTGGTGENFLQWQFAGLEPGGTYRVSTTWDGSNWRPTDAAYVIGGGAAPVTTIINQQLRPSSYPGSFAEGGVTWADLDTVYTILGTTLVVRLDDDHSGGCVLGDAVRIIQVTTPEITVLDGATVLTDGSTTPLDLGGSPVGVPWTRTFTVRNDGGSTLHLGTLSVPYGFTVVTGPAATVEPEAQTTFVLQFDALPDQPTYTGDVVLGNNDNNEAPFSFAIAASVGAGLTQASQTAPAPAPDPDDYAVLMDVLDVSAVPPTQLANDVSSVAYGAHTAPASVTRQYRIDNQGTSDVTVTNLVAPLGFTAGGLSPATVPAGGSATFNVALDTATPETYAGDVVIESSSGVIFRFEVTGEVVAGLPPLTAPIYIDNGDPGYTDTAGFYRKSGTGYLGDYEMAAGDSTGDYARWSFANLPDGTFRVSASWFGKSSFTSNAPYQLTGIDGGPQTVAVNQQVPPDDFVDQGVSWENLGTFQISGGTLVVELTDSTTGYLTADAIRVEQLTQPEITVLDGAVELTSGSSVVDFGGTSLDTPVSRTLTVRNDGGGPLQLPTSIVVPNGFSLTAPFGSTSLAPGQSTSFAIQLDADASGTFSGPISVQNNDADESPFQFTIQGTVGLGAAALTEPIYIDNGDAGYSSTAGFYQKGGTGYLGDYVLGKGDNNGDYAQWEFTGLPGGEFSVTVSYWTRSSWTDAAQYTVTWVDASNVTRNQTFSVNQRVAGDFYGQGAWWKQLGVAFEVQGGSNLTVRLTDDGGGYYVVGDAVRVEQLSPLEAVESALAGAVPAGAALAEVPQAVIDRAISFWAAGDADAAGKLVTARAIVSDLPGRVVGLASYWTNTVWLDADAAGWGWTVVGDRSSVIGGSGDGRTSFLNTEYRTPITDHRSPITALDLLTAVTHEFGHLLGLADLDDAHQGLDVMAGRIAPGASPWMAGIGRTSAPSDPLPVADWPARWSASRSEEPVGETASSVPSLLVSQRGVFAVVEMTDDRYIRRQRARLRAHDEGLMSLLNDVLRDQQEAATGT